MVIMGNEAVLNMVNEVLCRIDAEPEKEVRVGWLHCLNTLLDKGNWLTRREDSAIPADCTTDGIQHFASQNRIPLSFNHNVEPPEQNIPLPSTSHYKKNPQFAHSPATGSCASICNYTYMPPHKRVSPVRKFSGFHSFEFQYEPEERKYIDREWLSSWRELRLNYLEQRDNLLLDQTIVLTQQAEVREAEMAARGDLNSTYQYEFEEILLLEHEHRERTQITYEELLSLVLIAKSLEASDIQEFVYERAHLCFHWALLHIDFVSLPEPHCEVEELVASLNNLYRWLFPNATLPTFATFINQWATSIENSTCHFVVNWPPNEHLQEDLECVDWTVVAMAMPLNMEHIEMELLREHHEFGTECMAEHEKYQGFWSTLTRFDRIPFEYECEGGTPYQCGQELVHLGVWEKNYMEYVPMSVKRVNQRNKKKNKQKN